MFPFNVPFQNYPWTRTEPDDRHELARLMTGIWSDRKVQDTLDGPQFLGLIGWLRELYPQQVVEALSYGDSPLLKRIRFNIDRSAEVGVRSYPDE